MENIAHFICMVRFSVKDILTCSYFEYRNKVFNSPTDTSRSNGSGVLQENISVTYIMPLWKAGHFDYSINIYDK